MKVKDNKGRWISTDVVSRILEKTIKLSNGCLQYNGTHSIWGYGQITIDKKTLHAHRVMYEQLVGPISSDLVIDHLCRNKSCVNVDHLEAVTCKENLMRGNTLAGNNARKIHCIRGHEFDYVDKKGKRVCKTCKKIWYETYRYHK